MSGVPGIIGFVGAGRIGGRMVERLRAAGRPVRVHARRSEARERFAALGAEVVDTPEEVAGEIVVSCLYDDGQVAAVLPGVAAAMPAGGLLVSHTTGDPALLARIAEAGGVRAVEAAFSGTADAARAGTLVVLLGGQPAAVVEARGVVGAYAGTIVETGAAGTAARTKLLNNVLYAAISQVTLGALQAGRAMGVAEAGLLAVLGVASGGSTAAWHIAERGDPDRFAEAVTPYLRKDVATCAQVAAELGVDIADLLAAAPYGPARPHGLIGQQVTGQR